MRQAPAPVSRCVHALLPKPTVAETYAESVPIYAGCEEATVDYWLFIGETLAKDGLVYGGGLRQSGGPYPSAEAAEAALPSYLPLKVRQPTDSACAYVVEGGGEAEALHLLGEVHYHGKTSPRVRKLDARVPMETVKEKPLRDAVLYCATEVGIAYQATEQLVEALPGKGVEQHMQSLLDLWRALLAVGGFGPATAEPEGTGSFPTDRHDLIDLVETELALILELGQHVLNLCPPADREQLNSRLDGVRAYFAQLPRLHHEAG